MCALCTSMACTVRVVEALFGAVNAHSLNVQSPLCHVQWLFVTLG